MKIINLFLIIYIELEFGYLFWNFYIYGYIIWIIYFFLYKFIIIFIYCLLNFIDLNEHIDYLFS